MVRVRHKVAISMPRHFPAIGSGSRNPCQMDFPESGLQLAGTAESGFTPMTLLEAFNNRQINLDDRYNYQLG